MDRLTFFGVWIFIFSIGFLPQMYKISNKLWAQETKMLITQTACVDIPKLINTVSRNPDMQNYLLKAEEGYEKQSLSLERKIQELQNYLAKNQDNLSRQEIQDIRREIEYQQLELEQTMSSDASQRNMEEIILKGIYRLIKEVAEQDGLSIIIEKSSSVIYSRPEVDITDKIIAILDRSALKEEEESE